MPAFFGILARVEKVSASAVGKLELCSSCDITLLSGNPLAVVVRDEDPVRAASYASIIISVDNVHEPGSTTISREPGPNEVRPPELCFWRCCSYLQNVSLAPRLECLPSRTSPVANQRVTETEQAEIAYVRSLNSYSGPELLPKDDDKPGETMRRLKDVCYTVGDLRKRGGDGAE